jgi:DNA-binding NarL/FixJ family response regulator
VDVSSRSLVGREREQEAITAALAALGAGTGTALLVEGEPGIGKSRLLAYLAGRADGCTVLKARASEYEADLPYALWSDALDRPLAELGEHRLTRLGLADAPALAAVLPSLADGTPAHPDRHRVHRALRDLLERLAAAAPLVLCLDDVHWADPASAEALAALLHRPPAGRVLVALSARTGRLPGTLSAAVDGGRATRISLMPLDLAQARELVGARADAVYADSGGNPFYLEQLARAGVPAGPRAPEGDSSVPAPVAAALAAELVALPDGARRLLDAAAVVGDPFDVGLAAEVAPMDETPALHALDDLLEQRLVRPAGAARRFAFRHPVVRHALYEAAPGGWRIGAHARAAAALERRRAGPAQRAHHLMQAAAPGDEQAIAVLEQAAAESQALAPGSTAGFLAAVLRLLPDGPQEAPRRSSLQARLADAQAAAGDALGARETLLDAIRRAAPADRLRLTVGVANAEWWIGRTEDARRRLHVALGTLPAQPSPDRIRLRLALALTALMSHDLVDAEGQAADARDDARAISDPVFEAAALACGALTRVQAADEPGAGAEVDAAAASLERLGPQEQAMRLPAFWMLARARRSLGEFPSALADLERGAAIAADTGRERVLLQLTIEAALALIDLGRLRDAVATAEQGLEMARLSSNPRMLLWAHCVLSSARLAVGDVAGALEQAGAAGETGVSPDFHAAGQPGWCLGAALAAAGNPQAAVEAMLGSFGGPLLAAVVPAERPAAAADLAAAQFQCGDVDAAERTVSLGETAALGSRTPVAAAVIGTARSAVLLERGCAADALAAAAAALRAASSAPLAAARAQLAEGRALAAAGQRRDAVRTLVAAEARLDGFGAVRLRDEAARELRRLGHRVRRPARRRASATSGPLSEREREIALLVADGRTNREVAEQLVLSTRTVEAHLRNVYGKLGVRSRVELTRRLLP